MLASVTVSFTLADSSTLSDTRPASVDGGDGATQAARRHDAIVLLEIREQSLVPPLPFPLRPEEQQVGGHANRHHWQQLEGQRRQPSFGRLRDADSQGGGQARETDCGKEHGWQRGQRTGGIEDPTGNRRM